MTSALTCLCVFPSLSRGVLTVSPFLQHNIEPTRSGYISSVHEEGGYRELLLMQFFNSCTYLIQHVNVQLQTDAYFATYLYENCFLKLYHFYRYEHFDMRNQCST